MRPQGRGRGMGLDAAAAAVGAAAGLAIGAPAGPGAAAGRGRGAGDAAAGRGRGGGAAAAGRGRGGGAAAAGRGRGGGAVAGRGCGAGGRGNGAGGRGRGAVVGDGRMERIARQNTVEVEPLIPNPNRADAIKKSTKQVKVKNPPQPYNEELDKAIQEVEKEFAELKKSSANTSVSKSEVKKMASRYYEKVEALKVLWRSVIKNQVGNVSQIPRQLLKKVKL